jgi:DNA replication ATP-dependent helicase Dna2
MTQRNTFLEKRYHLDRLEYQGGSSGGLVNLVRLLSPDEERLRRLVVHRQAVSFLPGLKKDIIAVAKPILRPLNRSQQKAIFKTLMAEDYVLIKGMPGTGKTTVCATTAMALFCLAHPVLFSLR